MHKKNCPKVSLSQITNLFSEADKEADLLYKNKKFNKYTSQAKKDFYKNRLHERIKYKRYQRCRADIFYIVSSCIEESLPKCIEKDLNRFTEISRLI